MIKIPLTWKKLYSRCNNIQFYFKAEIKSSIDCLFGFQDYIGSVIPFHVLIPTTQRPLVGLVFMIPTDDFLHSSHLIH
ncbi:hypothetical protein [Chryseobacterium potabilaquae]|uniref:Uncharacterized protein n=1 Tax=Chryseobacterium potabilaquae TaxID=2675057 RepID=A0A6N4X5S6_9FLAO|nr:hypothetical protein [Chryseobacterium potabilaquae]CAA7194143.1 hypothetical protein CHRY9293_00520 [Chryseobacterium potabilaquae]